MVGLILYDKRKIVDEELTQASQDPQIHAFFVELHKMCRKARKRKILSQENLTFQLENELTFNSGF